VIPELQHKFRGGGLLFPINFGREGVERPFIIIPQMATPVSLPQNFEFVIRRTFWFPMVKIILWNIFIYGLDMTVLSLLQEGIFVASEERLRILFHLLGLGGTIWILLRWHAIKYTLTNTKIVLEKGILNIDRDTFLFRNIECLKLHKTLIGRLCLFGTIEMYAPTLQEHVFLRHITNAKKYARFIQHSIAQQQSNRIVYPSDYERKRPQLEGEKIRMAKGNLF
jgi:hypothetical protein